MVKCFCNKSEFNLLVTIIVKRKQGMNKYTVARRPFQRHFVVGCYSWKNISDSIDSCVSFLYAFEPVPKTKKRTTHEGTKNLPNLRKSEVILAVVVVVGWSFLVSNWGNSQMLQTVLEGSQVLLSCEQTWWLCHILFQDVKGHCSNASPMLAHEIGLHSSERFFFTH